MIYCLNINCNHINPDEVNRCQECQSSLLINNRYKAIKIIGKGGFGRTFLGQDECSNNKSRCVIKQSLIDTKNKQIKTYQLFEAEAKKLKYLGTYSQIPELIDSFFDDRHYYLIQEFINGENLQIELQKEGSFSEEKIIKLLKEVLSIIKFVHDNKIIHRDIKPANIIRNFHDQKIYLVDFGASKNISRQEWGQTATIIGSAEYIAPEQARGKALLSSDIYSLGVTCIHLLTNRSPFDLIDLDNNWIWQQYLPTKINPRLVKIINKMISLSPNQRYQNTKQIIDELYLIDRPFFTFPWRTFIIVSLAGISNLLLGKNFTPTPEKTTITQPEKPLITKLAIKEKKEDLDKIKNPFKSVKSKQKLEEEALQYLLSLTNIQEKIYLNNGEFIIDNFNLPVTKYVFITRKITDNRIAIVALAKDKELRNFIALLWGGDANSVKNGLKMKEYKAQDGDFGVLSKPQMLAHRSSSQKTQYTVRFNYCESKIANHEFPHFISSNTSDDSIPMSYQELACPSSYTYLTTMIEVMGKLSAQTLPVIIYDRDGRNLRINDNK